MEYEDGTPNRILLDYLKTYCRGRRNAKTWPKIHAYLKSRGIKMSQRQFQQGLLKESRQSDCYIGSYDKPPYKGYFLVVSREDAELMAAWYEHRIGAESTNLDNLRRLTDENWPEGSPG